MISVNISRRTAIGSILSASTVGSAILGVTPLTNTQHRGGSAGPKKQIGIVLFDQFETLDVFGPVEMWSWMPHYEVVMVSEKGGIVSSAQGVQTLCRTSFADAPQFEIIMIPGGNGTRREVRNPTMLEFLRKQDRESAWTTSVCTGAAVLAKAGVLDGRNATTNKLAYAWVTSQSTAVHWQPRARWVVDGKYITSSGVSAGMDMALGLIARIYGPAEAARVAKNTEYVLNSDPRDDPFSIEGNS